MDPSLQVILWTIILLLLFLTGIVSGAETAITSCNQFKLKVKANEGNKTAKFITLLTSRFDYSITSVVVAYNIFTTIISTIATTIFIVYIPAEGLSNLVSTIVITVITYVLGDTLPKIVARNYPEKFLDFTIYIIWILNILFLPLSLLFYGVTILTKKIFKFKNDATLTTEDFSNFVDEIEDKGILNHNESDIIINAIDFNDTYIKEVYTPLENMYMLDIDLLTNEKLNKILQNTNYSRIPIYEKDKENIIGILNVKKYFNAFIDDRHVSIRSILTKPYIIKISDQIDDIFDGFKKTHTHIALIYDEKNILIGMVTMEDILEELVDGIAEANLEVKKEVNV